MKKQKENGTIIEIHHVNDQYEQTNIISRGDFYGFYFFIERLQCSGRHF